MASTTCLICKKIFYAKPSHLKRGWGKYCSKHCQAKSQVSGKTVSCFNCKKKIWKTPKEIKASRSGHLFCSKSCSAVWRNKTVLIGEGHSNWKTGQSVYRDILFRSGKRQICVMCGLKDKRVLVVHHRDKNRKNNDVSNLCWVCCNCHFLIHNDRAGNTVPMV